MVSLIATSPLSCIWLFAKLTALIFKSLSCLSANESVYKVHLSSIKSVLLIGCSRLIIRTSASLNASTSTTCLHDLWFKSPPKKTSPAKQIFIKNNFRLF